jgi:phosphoribosyl 1,2-cyclic phosphate phosphodiesterase
LVDTPPDLRTQLLREGISIVHAVLFTHEHADHLHGLDDVRLFPFLLGHAMPIYASAVVEARIRRVFDYAFSEREPTHSGAVPQLQLHRIDDSPQRILGATVVPIPLIHGPHCRVYGFRVGNVAYCTDTNCIEDSSLALLEGLDCLVLDALRLRPHATHFSVDEALSVIDRLQPKQAYLTHLSHELDYETFNATLPPYVRLGYDGLRIPLT